MRTQLTIDVIERSLFAEGMTFGGCGSYERIKGRAKFKIDPAIAM